MAIRVTRGDGGLDGLVLQEGRVYQIYAPPSLGTDSNTAAKVKEDFNKAKITLNNSLKIWTFVHNSSDGKVGHLTASALKILSDENPAIIVEAIGIDGLWERLEKLPIEKLASLFGIPEQSNQAESQIRALLNRANELASQDNRRKAFETMEEALVMVESENLINLEAEILISLSLISSKRDGLGDRYHFLKRLQSLQSIITEAPVMVMFHRAQGAYFEDKRDLKAAESAYLAAIDLASLPDNAESCDEQLCIAQSEYVDFLCNVNRTHEAEEYIYLAESYAKSNPEILNGDIFQAALNAGLHWSAKTGDEDGVIERINALEASVNTAYRASIIGGQLINNANNLSHIELHRAALAASDAALRLTGNMSRDTRIKFLPGVLYTVAMVNFYAGRLEEALQKAKSLVNMAETPETAMIRFSAAQLISVISRQTGNLATAVEKAELALGLAPEIDLSIMAKLNLAEALTDSGQTERALELVKEVHHLVDGRDNVLMDFKVEIWGLIADYSAQLGKSDSLHLALSKLTECPTDDDKLRKIKEKFAERAKINVEIRKRIIDISLMGQGPDIVKESLERVQKFSGFLGDSKEEMSSSEESILTLQEANILTIAPIMKWWEDIADDYQAVALDYDYWGRGCFAQILQNLQSFPHSLNVTLEVRTLQDIRQAVRFWALYADFILLLWKGPTQSGKFIHMVDGNVFGPWGAGYLVAFGTRSKSKTGRRRYAATGHASWLPEDVAKFLVTEAKSFLASGRLLVVPATGVGCVSPGHGVMEQLLTEAANCIPAIQHDQRSDLEIGLLPYSVDIPLDILFDFVNETSVDLLRMRQLLLNKTAYIKANGLQPSPKALELEIDDTLKRLRSQNATLARKQNLSAAEQEAQMSISPFRVNGYGLLGADDAMYSPLLTLESMGYGWKVGANAQSRPAYRYKPAEGEAIGAWLAPPECGMRIAYLREPRKNWLRSWFDRLTTKITS